MKNQNKYKIGFSIAALLSLTVVFNQCVMESKVNKVPQRDVANEAEGNTYHNPDNPYDEGRDQENPYQDDAMAPPMVPVVDVNQVREVTPDYGIKNYEQIFYTMSTLTGVDPTNTRVTNVYNDVSSKLPNDNDIKTFSAANQVAIVKLAAEFCDLMIENATLRAQVYPNFNFGRTPNQELNDQNKSFLVERTISHFMGDGMLSVPERNFATVELTNLINDILEGSNLGSSVTTRMVGKGLCVAALGSIHTSLF